MSNPRLWTDLGANTGKLTTANDGFVNVTFGYNRAGQQLTTTGPEGTTSTTYTGPAGGVVPGMVTGGGLSATMNWNGFLGLTGVSPSNGDGVWFGYDGYARKATETGEDGVRALLC